MADWYKTSLPSGPGEAAAPSEPARLAFTSRRSPVLCRHACVASSQPLATGIGYDLLRQGANAAEAAVGVAAALAVTEPCSTGLGGDMFCLVYRHADRSVHAVNGSGRSPAGLSLDLLRRTYPAADAAVDRAAFRDSPHAVTVPGAAGGWQDLLDRHGSGRFPLAALLEPAARLAEEGFPVAPVTAHHWRAGMPQIRKWLAPGAAQPVPLSVDGGRGPEAGDVVRNPDLADVLRTLGREGAANGFYRGRPGQAIVDAVQRHGGCMTLQDLADHRSTFPEPVAVEYRGYKLWEVPPNGQGIAGLIALSGVRHLEEKGIIAPITPQSVHSADTYHALLEMMRLGFADATAHIADPDHMRVDAPWLLDETRIGNRVEELFDSGRARIHGRPDASSCTVSFQVVDAEGNAVSFVNSNFMGFGTGIVPSGCGFTLQNRGFGFTLSERHPNAPGPSKRPFHTIIPGMITSADSNDFFATISNMGGNMQPQGHLQLTVLMLAGGLDPQTAIDQPRFCISDGTQSGTACMEDGFEESVLQELLARGHSLKTGVDGHDRSLFGRAQIIQRDPKTGVLWAGSDGRADGCAMGF